MLKTAFILFLLLASGCKDQYTPKPYDISGSTFLKNSGSLLPTLYPIVSSNRHRPSWKPIPISRQNQGG